MKIQQIRAVQFPAFPNSTFVEIETDTGLIGLGETFYTPNSVTAYIQEVLASLLMERDPLGIEDFWRTAYDSSHVYGNRGLESRCLSAIDIALWDILGQHTSQPIWQLLGGTCHPEGVLIYNTCASAGYAQGTPGIWRKDKSTNTSSYQDYEAWQPDGDAGELAASLLKMGVRAMKIWPFDRFALANRGQSISRSELDEGLRPFKQIREAVGRDVEIILEGHCYWALEPARRIAEAVEPFKPALLEDLIKPDNFGTLAQLRNSTNIPLCASERLLNPYAFRDMLAAGACDVVMVDPSWAGGITECRKIAALADTYELGVIFHDCTGPVSLAAALHLAEHSPNTWMQEIVRAFTSGPYRELVDHLFEIENGKMRATGGPGLGVNLRKDIRGRREHILASHQS